MTRPTPADLRIEIETGALAADLLPFWGADCLFETEPEPPAALRPAEPESDGNRADWRAYQTRARWERIRNRFGELKPDPAGQVLRILSDPVRRTRTEKKTARGAFMAALAPIAISLAGKTEAVRLRWTPVLTLAAGGDEDVELDRPQIIGLFNMAVADGLCSQTQRDSILAGRSVPCSRLQELGWEVDADLVVAARAAGGV